MYVCGSLINNQVNNCVVGCNSGYCYDGCAKKCSYPVGYNKCCCYPPCGCHCNTCCRCCCPVVPTGPVPTIFGNGSFQSIRGIPIRNGEPYSLNNIFVQGNAITHVPGSSQIVLAPNTIFIFNWFNVTTSNIIRDVTVGASLELDGVPVQGGTATNSGPSGIEIIAQASGRFMTGDVPQSLTLNFLSNSGELDESFAELSLMVA